mmetsp:Transcript_3206/g.11580  ORF Transcript_3206/g.11580 Transcript_3206/m.11580 type:complete len:246 (-) Transcript_3206:613-1350(-)
MKPRSVPSLTSISSNKITECVSMAFGVASLSFGATDGGASAFASDLPSTSGFFTPLKNAFNPTGSFSFFSTLSSSVSTFSFPFATEEAFLLNRFDCVASMNRDRISVPVRFSSAFASITLNPNSFANAYTAAVFPHPTGPLINTPLATDAPLPNPSSSSSSLSQYSSSSSSNVLRGMHGREGSGTGLPFACNSMRAFHALNQRRTHPTAAALFLPHTSNPSSGLYRSTHCAVTFSAPRLLIALNA